MCVCYRCVCTAMGGGGYPLAGVRVSIIVCVCVYIAMGGGGYPLAGVVTTAEIARSFAENGMVRREIGAAVRTHLDIRERERQRTTYRERV